MVGTDHHIHTQEGGNNQFVKLSFLKGCIRTRHPFTRLNQHDKRSQCKDGFNDTDRGIGLIHPAECCRCLDRKYVDHEVSNHQYANQWIKPFALFTYAEEICPERDNQHSHQRYFGQHSQKLTVIYIHFLSVLFRVKPLQIQN